MTLHSETLASRITRKSEDGATTGPRIHTSRCDVVSAQCKASVDDKLWSGSSRFIPRSSITSTRIATSTAGTSLRPTATPLSLSGVNSARPDSDDPRLPETGSLSSTPPFRLTLPRGCIWLNTGWKRRLGLTALRRRPTISAPSARNTATIRRTLLSLDNRHGCNPRDCNDGSGPISPWPPQSYQ